MHILYSVQKMTHPGKVRANNQDAYGVVLDWRKKLNLSDADLQERGHLFAVADGMGGHAAGEVASQLAIETLFRAYYTTAWQGPKANLEAAIAAANDAIRAKADAHPEMAGMGTTLVAALYRPEEGWLFANVGDSRGYLFRDGRIEQVTQDHSWVAEQTRSGILTQEQAAHHPLRNVITRSLGSEEHVTPDFFSRDARPGDIVLLCSDGLSNLVGEKEMADLLKSYSLDEAAEKLLDRALERGAPDNVTFLLTQLVGGKQRRSRSILPWLALIAAIFILGGFLFWNFTRPQPAPPPATPVALLATNTPILPSPTPDRATPTPTQETIAAAALPASSPLSPPLPIDPIVRAASVIVTPIPSLEGSPKGFVFVQGPATIRRGEDEDAIIITHIDLNDNTGHEYIATLPGDALQQSWIAAKQAVLGLPEDAWRGEQESPGAWFLAPLERGQARFSILWLSPEAEALIAQKTPILLYTVNGQGGGDSLGVDTPPGQEGAPIAVLGTWQRLLGDDWLDFEVKQVFDYDETGHRYRPRP